MINKQIMNVKNTTNSNENLIRFLIFLGGLVGLIEAIVGFISPRWFSWIGSIFGIIFSLITLFSISSPENKFVQWYFSLSSSDWILYLVLSILLILFGSTLGGIIVLIALIIGYLLSNKY